MGDKFVVEGIEPRGNLGAVHIVHGFGTNGDLRALFCCSASGALFSDDLHGGDEFFSVFGNAKC